MTHSYLLPQVQGQQAFPSRAGGADGGWPAARAPPPGRIPRCTGSRTCQARRPTQRPSRPLPRPSTPPAGGAPSSARATTGAAAALVHAHCLRFDVNYRWRAFTLASWLPCVATQGLPARAAGVHQRRALHALPADHALRVPAGRHHHADRRPGPAAVLADARQHGTGHIFLSTWYCHFLHAGVS